jgi:hypothetical protein
MVFGFIQKNYNKKYLSYIDSLFYPKSNTQWNLKSRLIEAYEKKERLTKKDIYWPLRDFGDVNFNERDNGYDGQILPYFKKDGNKDELPYISICFYVDMDSNSYSITLLGHLIFQGLEITQHINKNDKPKFIIVPHDTRTKHIDYLKQSLIDSGNYIYDGDKTWFQKELDKYNL